MTRFGDPASIPDDRFMELTTMNMALNRIGGGQRIRVTHSADTEEGTFAGLFINHWEGLGLYLAYERGDVKGAVAIPGRWITKIELLEDERTSQ